MSAKINNLYKTKDVVYFESVRKDILPLLPQKMNRILEVGCGSGNTLDYIKNNITIEWIENFNMLRGLCEMRIQMIELSIDEANLGITNIDEYKDKVVISFDSLIVAISERLVLGI